jgi:hypothetical protein
MGYAIIIIDKKIIVFEYKKHEHSADDTDKQVSFFPFSFRSFNPNPGKVVDQDRNKQDQDVVGDEEHIKDATGDEYV